MLSLTVRCERSGKAKLRGLKQAKRFAPTLTMYTHEFRV